MGFFPNAGQSYYLINVPYFDSTTLHLENGDDFTITTENMSTANKYIQSAYLNGEDYDLSWIEHKDILDGGELRLIMGSMPSDWGTTLLPPSMSNN